MNSNTEKLRKEIQKIIYKDLEVWKQHIKDLEAKKIEKNTFKRHYVEFLQKIEENILNSNEYKKTIQNYIKDYKTPDSCPSQNFCRTI